MKKLLALLLTLMMFISVFAACANNVTPENPMETSTEKNTEKDTEKDTQKDTETDTQAPDVDKTDLQAALEYVHQMYKDNLEKTAVDYDLLTKVKIGDESFTVTG